LPFRYSLFFSTTLKVVDGCRKNDRESTRHGQETPSTSTFSSPAGASASVTSSSHSENAPSWLPTCRPFSQTSQK
jgi:hypothetical protein